MISWAPTRSGASSFLALGRPGRPAAWRRLLTPCAGRALFVAILCGAPAGVTRAQAQELYVANAGTNSVTVYNRTDSGDTAPLRTLSGVATGLNQPRGIAIDLTNNELFVSNINGNSVTVYGLTASGDVAPLRTISGGATLLDFPVGVALDLVNDELVVVNRSAVTTSTNASVVVYSRTANGNVAPLRTIAGAATGLNLAHLVAVDTVANEILVTNAADRASPPGIASVTVYDRTSSGNVAPLRTLSGASTGLAGPIGLGLDRTNDEIAVSNVDANSITVFSRTASGDTAPLRTIAGVATGLNFPVATFVDLASDEILVANQSGNSVTVYDRTANGDAAPLRTLSGDATGLSVPGVLALTDPATPQPMAVDARAVTGSNSNANGVLEPGETVQVAPAWHDTLATPLSFTGTASNITGPGGPTYTLDDSSADYGILDGGATGDCDSATGDCYLMTVSGTRPATHWDAAFTENLSSSSTNKVWTVHVGESFSDVPTSNQFYGFIENLFHNIVTSGCGGSFFCPIDSVTRAQMAVFLLKGKFGATHVPPPATGTVFSDVHIGDFAADWIEELAGLQITGGCGGGNYCPNNPVRRDQMAAFLLKAQHGSSYTPPACTGVFPDVLCPSLFADWIERLFAEAITGGCGAGNYCPNNPNTRGQMAVFLVKTFGLLLYGP